MSLDIYAGNKLIVTLVEFYEVHGHDLVLKPDHYAIPGRHVASEKTVRKWAKEYGYTVKSNWWMNKEGEFE